MKLEKKEIATFVTGCARSGTTLMTALLDNHPELLVFPEESLYLQPPGKTISGNQCILSFLFKNRILLRLQGETNYLDKIMPEQRNYDGFDYYRFKEMANKHFQIRKERNAREKDFPALALLALFDGYENAIDKGAYSRWVVKSPNYELYWRKLFEDFPAAKVIFMVRDPRDVILSRTIKRKKKRYLQRGGDPATWKPEQEKLKPPILFLKMWERSITEFIKIRKTFPNQIFLVRYEDLVAATRDVMQALSDFLGIHWDDSLLVPSFLGRSWKGNSMHQRKFRGGIASDSQKKNNLAPHYQWQIEAWFGDLMFKEPGRYDPSGVLDKIYIKALISPLSDEGVLEFLQNRARMWTNQRQQLRCH